MATLYVRDIPENLYRQVRKTAEHHGRSLSSFVVGLLKRSVEDEKLIRRRKRALAHLRERRQPLPSDAPDSVEILKQIRADRG